MKEMFYIIHINLTNSLDINQLTSVKKVQGVCIASLR